ncbi:MAG TPA: DNA gyrase subunit A [Gammaproteobacteria bacterium]|nr:DNA gyrase subunit A [Gammaproteobacteria bacterium]
MESTDSQIIALETIPANLEQEMRRSYLDYAMSVIVGRALPDVCDGLKPVHRRVLYAMHELGNDWNKAYKKSARVVGDVIGKYHPHGDTAVYDTIVRMAQSFSMRYPLVDGQGNFGSVDGDSPAAMRYTEIRLSKIAHELLSDLDRDTVDFVPNYDESETQPAVLPARIPNLLVNGSSGIAVGMATNIPPHNLTEVVNGCLAYMDNPSITAAGLMEYIPGPDFPTAAMINGSRGIRSAYLTGRGKIYIRGRTKIEHNKKTASDAIVVTELPYQVNKARLLEKIAELIKNKRMSGISALRDESDKDGMRMVIELRRGEVPEVVLNNLYQHTQLQNVFGINMVALVNNQPKTFALKELIEEFVRHRREVVTRRSIFDLNKARDRAHRLEGLAVALSNIDAVITLIKAAANSAEAKQKLLAISWEPGVVKPMLDKADATLSRPGAQEMNLGMGPQGYRLSAVQAQAILDLQLHRLTGLEQDRIYREFSEILLKVAELLKILRDPDRLMEVIREELVAVREQYGDVRRTEILQHQDDLTDEDLIVEEDRVVTLSHHGYAKSQPLADYQTQHRGGRGRSATRTREEDFVASLFVVSTHDTILCFSSRGKVYWLKVYHLPQAGPQARGRPLVNLLPLEKGESVTAVLPIRDYLPGSYVMMATVSGVVKKTPLTAFSNPRSNGIIAISLRDNDYLVGVGLTRGDSHVLLFSNAGKAIRFRGTDIRSMGRTAQGVRGINLKPQQRVISMVVVDAEEQEENSILLATENGYGKRTHIDEFPCKNRGGQGVISIQITERNGPVVGARQVTDGHDMMLITDAGVLIRSRVDEVSCVGRNTQGVRLINIGDDEVLVSLGVVEEDSDVPSVAGVDPDGDSNGVSELLADDSEQEGGTT